MKTVACLIVGITLALVCLNGAQLETNGCNTNCTSEWNSQICATNDEGTTKVFPSECFMKLENCLYKTKYVKSQPGPAEGGSCP